MDAYDDYIVTLREKLTSAAPNNAIAETLSHAVNAPLASPEEAMTALLFISGRAMASQDQITRGYGTIFIRFYRLLTKDRSFLRLAQAMEAIDAEQRIHESREV